MPSSLFFAVTKWYWTFIARKIIIDSLWGGSLEVRNVMHLTDSWSKFNFVYFRWYIIDKIALCQQRLCEIDQSVTSEHSAIMPYLPANPTTPFDINKEPKEFSRPDKNWIIKSAIKSLAFNLILNLGDCISDSIQYILISPNTLKP